ncbi:putative UDP-glucose 4-epimerase [Thozetella sp. PMI_491]|nr:putative UDP-glucose 4-epimerase [Thozetella sp. PMI_491]
MRVFVTGATGFIGQAVVSELLSAGHKILGLARDDSSAAKLTARGVEVHRGSLEDLESLEKGAAACDGVIHLAFDHANMHDVMAVCAKDRAALSAMATAMINTDRPIVIAATTTVLGKGQESDEDSSEAALLPFAKQCVRACVVRLAPTVHGDGDMGFVARLVELARTEGKAAYVGNGENRWPAVHRLDAARLFRLAVEKCAPGSVLHATAEDGVPFKDIAAAISKKLDVPLSSITEEEKGKHFGMLALFSTVDVSAPSVKTRERLGWAPQHPTLLEDIDSGIYTKPGTGSKYGA